jgi:adenylate cyclase
MSDVFVSYARPDEPQAKRVAEALHAAGYSAWRDDQLPAHRAYGEVIEERPSWTCRRDRKLLGGSSGRA